MKKVLKYTHCLSQSLSLTQFCQKKKVSAKCGMLLDEQKPAE